MKLLALRHAFYAFVGIPLAGLAWIWFIGEPYAITGKSVTTSAIFPGSVVTIKYEGTKAQWAAKLCKPVEGSVFFTDAAGTPYLQKALVGYNDGTLDTTVRHYQVPERAVPGLSYIQESVDLECLGFVRRTWFFDRVEFLVLQFPSGRGSQEAPIFPDPIID